MSLHVLLADDDKMAVFLQKIIILESGFTTTLEVFSNGFETLEYLSEHYKNGDQFFIFLDINMPRMSGWELLDEINKKEYAQDVFVAMVTSYSALEEQASSYYPQIIYSFEKPVTIEGCIAIMQLPQMQRYFPT